MTKKRSSEISGENGKIFREKVKFSTESENFRKIGENLKQGRKYIMASGGMDAPGHEHT